MVCPKCGSENVKIDSVQTGAKTKKKSNGFLQIMMNFIRFIFVVCTLGLAALFWKKNKGNSKTTFIMQKVCSCQSCGHSWTLDGK